MKKDAFDALVEIGKERTLMDNPPRFSIRLESSGLPRVAIINGRVTIFLDKDDLAIKTALKKKNNTAIYERVIAALVKSILVSMEH
jgi:hypothetical protein